MYKYISNIHVYCKRRLFRGQSPSNKDVLYPVWNERSVVLTVRAYSGREGAACADVLLSLKRVGGHIVASKLRKKALIIEMIVCMCV